MCVSNIYENTDPAASSSSHCTPSTVMMKLVHNKMSSVLLVLSFVGLFSTSSAAYQSLAALTVTLSIFDVSSPKLLTLQHTNYLEATVGLTVDLIF